MVDLVLFTLVEAWATAYLRQQLAARGQAAEVSTKYPRPGTRHVRVEAAGGPIMSEVLSDRLLIVQCYAESEPQAARLAELSLAILRAAPRDPVQKTVRNTSVVGTPVLFRDPASEYPRYQFTVSLLIRGEVI